MRRSAHKKGMPQMWNVAKSGIKKRGDVFRKIRESLSKKGILQHGICARELPQNANKKEFLYTICAGAKNLDFLGKTELVDTITRAWGNHQKLTLKTT